MIPFHTFPQYLDRPNIYFRILTEFLTEFYSVLKCATATKWLHKHNLSCLCGTPLTKQHLHGPRENGSGLEMIKGRVHQMEQVDKEAL